MDKNLKNFSKNNSHFIKLVTANAISRFGDSIDTIAFSWLTYHATNSAALAATVFGVNRLVSIVFQPIIGSVVENLHKKKVMVYSDILRFAVILAFFITCRMGFVSPATLICFTVVVSSIETFRLPSGVAIIPLILAKDDYDRGVSINRSLAKGSELIGFVSAAALIAAIGTDGAILVDGITFLISGLLISTIKYESIIKQNDDQSTNYLKMTWDGIKFIWMNKQLLIVCIIGACINASVIPFDSLMSAYCSLYFNNNVHILTAICLTIAVGMIVGSAFYQFLPKKYMNNFLITICGILLGLFYIGTFIVTRISVPDTGSMFSVRFIILETISFVIGVALALANAYFSVCLLSKTKQEFLSRSSSIAMTNVMILEPITAFFIGVLATIFDTATIYLGWGVLVTIAFILLQISLGAGAGDDKRT